MSSSVEDWLRSLGFIHYTQAFLDNGYDELEICKEIGKEDLDAIGVRNFKDRTDILNAVERLKQSGNPIFVFIIQRKLFFILTSLFQIVDHFDIFWTWIKSFFVESWILAAIYCMFYCN